MTTTTAFLPSAAHRLYSSSRLYHHHHHRGAATTTTRMLQTATHNPHIRLVASDVDGTLLTTAHTIAPRTVQAIRGVREKGVLFVPATGKSRGGVRNALGDLGRELTDPRAGLSVGGVYLQVGLGGGGLVGCVELWL